ncbi:putative retinol dehydrogenase 8 protein [Botrytis fragariae]|uniref:Putative retinol dehydrogenase 8 protein n=1 Tax=Botrytis fragariae TaxID=1964551 RepID=A0A8H6AI65_9HELO|nr:putative retinol dehydrogenase 8 protein [Botrytis fragariae]KAF5867822.1 putative retinol dehydrogenase 8 protein [Botrytis fragariae]
MSSTIKIDSNLPADTVWFITGCSSGIGKSLAVEIFNTTTHSIIATARNPSSLSYLPRSPRILALALDVTSQSSITEALASGLSTFKHIDILVNNAGYGVLGDTEFIPDDTARKILETNFWGAVRLTNEAVRIFREVNGEKGGLIMQISTMGGVTAFAGQAYYHARTSKFALEGFTESLYHEIPKFWNIRFLIIEPGGVRTNYGTSSLVKIPAHPVYADPSFGTRQLEAFLDNPSFGDYMADPDRVAQILLEATELERKGKMGLRLPVGPDSWSFIKRKHEGELEGLEKVKELSWSTGNESILKLTGFLSE